MKNLKYLTWLVLLSILYSCDSYDLSRTNPFDPEGINYKPAVPQLTTANVTNINSSAATIGGNVISEGGSEVTARGSCWSMTNNPTIEDAKTTDGKGIGRFTSLVKGLAENTAYFVRSYATNKAGTGYGPEKTFTTSRLGTAVTDIDGNDYHITAIGTQIWMVENLKVTKLNDGSEIPLVLEVTVWSALSSPGYCYYDNNDTTNRNTYGALYNWYTVNAVKLCPAGWHVPSDQDWVVLTNFLGGNSSAGGKMKESGTAHWRNNNIGATNESGFTALPGGGRDSYPTATFYGLTSSGTWWSTSESVDGVSGSMRTLRNDNIEVNWGGARKRDGCSVRCIKDPETTVNFLILSTQNITDITPTTAICGGNIISNGGSPITARGVCWNTSPVPTTSNTITSDGTGTGSYTSSLTGLTASTKYYVRSYATNSSGTSYGNEVTFTTNVVNPVLPTLSTASISAITPTTATSGGNITNDGGAAVVARGVCWNTQINPTTANNKTSDLTGTGVYTSNITGLTGSTTYYVRAYATNSAGTAYGDQVNFTTSSAVPVVTTAGITSIYQTSAIGGGEVISDGGVTITERGICYSTSQNPVITGNKKTAAGTTGTFNCSLSGLSFNTTYYVRAFATNSAGTSYGEQVSFTTLGAPPTITTAAMNAVTPFEAIAGGYITTSDSISISERGVCYGTSQTPTTSNNKIAVAGKTGNFSCGITGLTASTLYYVRAFVTTNVSTFYGAQVIFTTANVNAIPDVEGNYYNIVTIGTQTWMSENLKTKKFNDGTLIPEVTDKNTWAVLSTPALCWYNNNAVEYKATYGTFYNYAVINTAGNGGKNVCPTNWHVPSVSEWTILINYLGGDAIAGGKLKETGTIHWADPNTGATNEAGFKGLPGGGRNIYGDFFALYNVAYWWSASEDGGNVWCYALQNDLSSIQKISFSRENGWSVRCLRNF